MTYSGYDYLALHAHSKASAVVQFGSPMGQGKESDIWLVTVPANHVENDRIEDIDLVSLEGQLAQAILKVHRLGRTSFRSVQNNRAYLGKRTHGSWQYLSRLSAQKEYTAMRALHSAGFRVPRPIAQNRHSVVMSLVPGYPLRSVPLKAFGASRARQSQRVAELYDDCLEIALSLAEVGVIHGDLNEFNILVENVPELDEDDADDLAGDVQEDASNNDEATSHASDSDSKPLVPHLIDFPQIISMSHPQAGFYFDRDIQGIKSSFRKRYHFESEDSGPLFADASQRLRDSKRSRLDVETEAAGFSKKMAKELEQYYSISREDAEGSGDDEPTMSSATGFEDEDPTVELDDSHSSRHDIDANPQEAVPFSLPATSAVAKTQENEREGQLLQKSADRGSEEQAVQQELNRLNLSSVLDVQSPAKSAKTKAAAGWSI